MSQLPDWNFIRDFTRTRKTCKNVRKICLVKYNSAYISVYTVNYHIHLCQEEFDWNPLQKIHCLPLCNLAVVRAYLT